MKMFLKQHLNIFPKLRRRLSSVKWALLLATTAMFFVSAAAPNGCNFMISFGGNGPTTSITGPSPQSSPPSSASPAAGGSPTAAGGAPAVGGSPTAGGSPMAGAPPTAGGSPTAGAPPAAGGSPTAGGSPSTQPTTSDSSPSGGGAVHMVMIASGPPSPTDLSGFIFVDSTSKTDITTIPKGTTVEWINPTGPTSAPHTVTASDGSFDSGIFAPGKTYSRTFSQAGTFKYVCNVHPGQVGTIIVQ